MTSMTSVAAAAIHPISELTRSYVIIQVDSFTRMQLAGNPCAVIFCLEEMSDATMQAVAREMNLPVTSFVLNPRKSNFRARYFTLEAEISFAGHPTLATIHALYQAGQIECFHGQATVTLELGGGIVTVEIAEEDGGTPLITMEQKAPTFLQTLDTQSVIEAVGIDEFNLIDNVPPQIVSTGVPQLIIPVKSLDALRRAQPDLVALAALKRNHGISSAHLFCLEGVTETGDTFARNFDTPPEILEDPFTGSANGAMAAYCWRYGLISEPKFTAQQGHWIDRPGEAYIEVVGSRYEIDTVRLGGYAVIVLKGKITI